MNSGSWVHRVSARHELLHVGLTYMQILFLSEKRTGGRERQWLPKHLLHKRVTAGCGCACLQATPVVCDTDTEGILDLLAASPAQGSERKPASGDKGRG